MAENFKPTILDRLNLADVSRWHLLKTKKPQNLSEHTYGVVVLAMELYELLNHKEEYNLRLVNIIQYALIHDIDELITGDIPSPTKPRIEWVNPVLIEDNANELEHSIVKIADMLEAVYFFNINADGYRSDSEYKAILANTKQFILHKLSLVENKCITYNLYNEALILLHKLTQPKQQDYSSPTNLNSGSRFGVLVNDQYFSCSKDTTILSLLEEDNFNLPHNCRNGHCGVCKLKVKYGSFSYGFGSPLAHEDGTVLACKAIPISNCILEVDRDE